MSINKNQDYASQYISLRQLNEDESASIYQLKQKRHDKAKIKQKRINHEIRKASKKCRVNKNPNDLLNKFKVLCA